MPFNSFFACLLQSVFEFVFVLRKLLFRVDVASHGVEYDWVAWILREELLLRLLEEKKQPKLKWKIGELKVDIRFRKDFGDLAVLIKSISEVGLFHPIVVDGAYVLVAGKRRLIATNEFFLEAVPLRPLR